MLYPCCQNIEDPRGSSENLVVLIQGDYRCSDLCVVLCVEQPDGGHCDGHKAQSTMGKSWEIGNRAMKSQWERDAVGQKKGGGITFSAGFVLINHNQVILCDLFIP